MIFYSRLQWAIAWLMFDCFWVIFHQLLFVPQKVQEILMSDFFDSMFLTDCSLLPHTHFNLKRIIAPLSIDVGIYSSPVDAPLLMAVWHTCNFTSSSNSCFGIYMLQVLSIAFVSKLDFI